MNDRFIIIFVEVLYFGSFILIFLYAERDVIARFGPSQKSSTWTNGSFWVIVSYRFFFSTTITMDHLIPRVVDSTLKQFYRTRILQPFWPY